MKKQKTTAARFPAYFLCALVIIFYSERIYAQQQSENAITSEMVKPHINELAGDKYGGRGAGYRGERKAGDYIAKQFKKAGLKPAGTNGKYFQEFSFYPINPVGSISMLSSRNILGLIEGTDPLLKNEIVVIGAHYDGQGMTGQADPGRYMPRGEQAIKDEIWNSANDNAASVAAIIEIGRAIKKGKITTKRSILFIAFGCEEHGVAGSMHYINNPIAPLNKHIAMINLEKLGRSKNKSFNTSGNASSKTWDEVLKVIQGPTNTSVTTANPYVIPESDHYPFNASRIPAIMFYTTGIAAHDASDIAETIDFNRVADAARFVMLMSMELSNRAEQPKWVASPMADLGISAHLASGNEADKMGLDQKRSGLKVTGIVPGLPAAIAGIQPGDVITEFATYQFERGESLESLQKKHMDVLMGKHGEKLSVTVLRDGKPVVLQMNLRAG